MTLFFININSIVYGLTWCLLLVSGCRQWVPLVYTKLYSRVEWFSTTCDFRKPTSLCGSGIFLGAQFQKISEFQAAKFSFSKNHRDHKNLYFQYIQEQIESQIKNFYIYVFPQKGKTVFDLTNRGKNNWGVSLHFYPYQRICCPLSQASNTFLVVADFRVTVKICGGPATS